MKSGGTQLKLIMTFQNYGQALFKPMNGHDREAQLCLKSTFPDARHRGPESSWRVGEEEEEQCEVKGKRGERKLTVDSPPLVSLNTAVVGP
ncbi:Extracellular serine/threonine protein kinase FAM20C [Liparis tanakae]|uniref:Extracellular serine/threonine protein kinase FAM20C n=1 Tax=Liparis tanakae TaxID=230148 RepID=A0A4Z2I4H0_9TELE|nr:Extracellular serine/threonine protein kinase FAM20C [Liparis tanakae]